MPPHIWTALGKSFEERGKEDITMAIALELATPHEGVVTLEQIYQL